jgi:hypothetical protein
MFNYNLNYRSIQAATEPEATTFPCDSLKISDAKLKHVMRLSLLKNDDYSLNDNRKWLTINYMKNPPSNMLR